MDRLKPYDREESLLHDFICGEELALKTLHKIHYSAILQYAKKIVLYESDAEEIVAEAFMRLWLKRNQMRTVGGLIGYLYAIVRNLAINQNKDYAKRKSLLDEIAQQSGREVCRQSEETKSRLVQAILIETSELPTQMKKVFEMAYLDGMLAPAIASKLSISVNTVQNHKKAALKRIRTALVKRGISKWSFIIEFFIFQAI